MNIRTILAATAAAVAMAAAGSAAAITITVTPTLGPNGYGSPSYGAWIDNAVYAQLNGLTSYGDPSLPTNFQAQSNVTSAESIVTGFSSWKGVADAGGAFQAERGNRMHFALLIDGGGTQFSISQLSLVMDSNDPFDALDYTFGAGGYNYGHDYRGINYGANGVLGGGDDTFVIGGPNTQLVDGLVGRGSGNSLAAYCAGCDTTAERQAALDGSAAYFEQFASTQFTGTYSLGNLATGSGTFNISGAVPEPGTWALMIGGFGMAGAALRRRRALAA